MTRFVIFGVTGGLGSRLLLPAPATLVGGAGVADGLARTGVGTQPLARDEFRQRIRAALGEHAANVDPAARARVVEVLDYQQADVTSERDVARVLGPDGSPVVVYLALPPRLFE